MSVYPGSWKTMQLDEVALVQTGISKSANRSTENVITLPYLRVANVQDGRVDLAELKTIEVPRDKVERYSVRPGDILLTEGGDFDKLGRGCVWQGQVKRCVHQNHIFVVRPDKKRLLPEFLSLLCASRYGRGYFMSCAKQTTNLASINSSQLKEFPLLVPPLEEQKSICAVLQQWNRAIDLTERLLDEKRLRRKGLMQQLLTGKRRLPGFVGKWEEYEIGKLFREVNRSIEWDEEELYDLLSVRRRSGGLFHRESLYGRQILTKNLKTARAGDFLISKMQVLHGATGLVTSEFDEMKISGSYISLVPRKPERISAYFFSYFSQLPSFYHLTFLASYGVHIEKMTFNTKWFMRSKIFIPPTVEEQKAIAKFISTVDRELELLQAKANALREQKKSLMHQLLTGKKRVKV